MLKRCSSPVRLEVEEWTGSESDSELRSVEAAMLKKKTLKLSLSKAKKTPAEKENRFDFINESKLKRSVKNSSQGIQLLLQSGVLRSGRGDEKGMHAFPRVKCQLIFCRVLILRSSTSG